MNLYAGLEQDVERVSATAKRLKQVGWFILGLFGPPSLFLFVGTMIAKAMGQPVAARALIVFPALAFVVFGSGTSYLILARRVRLGKLWAVILCLCIAISASFLGLFDFWAPLVGDWIVIARVVVFLTNLVLVKPLIQSIGSARRLDRWTNSMLAGDEEMSLLAEERTT